MNSSFSVRFWGVRGTVACPGPRTAIYGGNTACVEVRCGDTLLILDAGTGLRPLGKDLIARREQVSAHVLMTHTHLDHIQGLPFFKPAYLHGTKLEFWNGHLRRQRKRIETVLGRIMQAPYFPVPMNIMHAEKIYHDFEAGESLEIGTAVKIRTAELNHPGGATAYRIDFAGKSLCYVTDTEHLEGKLDGRILDLIAGSELVIYDATYTDEEYPRFRGWGHSTWQQGVRLCAEAGAGRLAAFHHDPEHDDEKLARIDEALGATRGGSIVARETMLLEL